MRAHLSYAPGEGRGSMVEWGEERVDARGV
jgi:hypothetical protein